ncbi:cation transporting ATPase C-terminal domain-containing protein, partial [bacterium]|nr:cation transporting ATPase C-terminal domain-containing protein [bacterium]
HESLVKARTMAFTVMVLAELFQAFNARSLRESVFSRKLHANWNLVAAVLSSLGLQLILIYTPVLHRIFQTESLSMLDLGIGVVMASLTLWATEIGKLVLRHRPTTEQE